MLTLNCYGDIRALTLYHTNPTFDNPEKEAFRKHCGKRRKCWLPAFSPFPKMFSTLHKTNLKSSVTFILSFANTFNLDKPKILSFGRRLLRSYNVISPPPPKRLWVRSPARQTKVFKTSSSGFPLCSLRIMGMALRLARLCQDNGLLKY